jgi:hypothetical protein
MTVNARIDQPAVSWQRSRGFTPKALTIRLRETERSTLSTIASRMPTTNNGHTCRLLFRSLVLSRASPDRRHGHAFARPVDAFYTHIFAYPRQERCAVVPRPGALGARCSGFRPCRHTAAHFAKCAVQQPEMAGATTATRGQQGYISVGAQFRKCAQFLGIPSNKAPPQTDQLFGYAIAFEPHWSV